MKGAFSISYDWQADWYTFQFLVCSTKSWKVYQFSCQSKKVLKAPLMCRVTHPILHQIYLNQISPGPMWRWGKIWWVEMEMRIKCCATPLWSKNSSKSGKVNDLHFKQKIICPNPLCCAWQVCDEQKDERQLQQSDLEFKKQRICSNLLCLYGASVLWTKRWTLIATDQ